MAIWGDGQKLCRLLIEVFATPATICDKTLTRQQNHVAKLLCLQHPIPSQSLESDGVDEIIEDAGMFIIQFLRSYTSGCKIKKKK